MLDRLAAFQLGYAATRVGFRFNAVEVLQRLQPAEPPLLDPVNAWMTALNERRAEIVHNVLAVERLMGAAGLAPPERPQTYAQYQSWAATAVDRSSTWLSAKVAENAAFLLGLALGDLATTLALEVLVGDLLAAEPAHPFLTAQAAALAGARTRGLAELRLAAKSTGVPAAAEGVLGEIVSLSEAGRLAELEAKRPALEAALATP